ncbi:MAG: ABC transporter permease [Thermoanaerobaculia bacterium]
MTGFLLRRLVASLLLVVVVLTLTFFLIHLAPGDPSNLLLDPRVSRQHQEALNRLYGLDRPLLVQYGSWLRASLLEGNWGVSFVHRRPVTAVIADHLPQTLLLSATALVIQFGVGILLGVGAARNAGSRRDHLIRLGALSLYSLPLFWLGLMALLLLSFIWPIFPSGHMSSVGADQLPAWQRLLDLLHHLALPALVLGLASAGAITRFTRNSLLEVIDEDFVRTARAKGVDEGRVFWSHALRNSLAPIIQLLGLSLPFLLSGSLVTEVVFSWPGLGRLTYDSILSRDYPVILASTALAATLVVAGSFLADLLHAAADPRVRTWER